jgi:hypothetical protein
MVSAQGFGMHPEHLEYSQNTIGGHLMKLNGYTSLDDVPEIVRGICTVGEDGVVSLDETKIKTQQDIDKVLEAKRKESADHNATKAQLALWQKLGENPDAVSVKIADLESRAGDSSGQTTRIAELLREKSKLSGEYESLKAEHEKIKPEYEKILQKLQIAKTHELMEREVGKLQGVDAKRLLQSLKKDVSLKMITVDESGEGLIVSTGESFAEYAKGQADIFNFKVSNTPGASNPGSDSAGKSPSMGANSFVDDETAALLDS